jgi:CRISPR system Cascade subunit CasA
MSASFNLLESNWIPVRWIDGSTGKIGLRTVLCEANRIATLECSTPIRQIAMLRLLLAVAHRADRLPTVDAAVERLDGKWPAEKFLKYLGTWAGSFELYDPDRPFLQAPWLGKHAETSMREHPLARIVNEWSSGNNKLLMDHHHEAVTYVEPAEEVAQALVAYQQFCAGGTSQVLKTSDIGGPGMGFAHIWVTAPTLSRFLTLNQLPQSKAEFDLDLPSWECAPISHEDVLKEHAPFPGPASRYCHQSRSVLLLPTSNGECGSLRWAEGIARKRTLTTQDPMEAQKLEEKNKRNKEGIRLSLRLSEERAIWRDSQCLVVNASSYPPPVVRNAMQVISESDYHDAVTLGIGGLLAGKAKNVLWRIEQITAPRQVLQSAQLWSTLILGIEMAEEAGQGLLTACSKLVGYLARDNDAADPDKKKVHPLAKGLPGFHHYWHQLDVGFPVFLEKLQTPEAIRPAMKDWSEVISIALQSAWQASIHSVGHNSKSLIAAAKAEPAYLLTKFKLKQKLGGVT